MLSIKELAGKMQSNVKSSSSSTTATSTTTIETAIETTTTTTSLPSSSSSSSKESQLEGIFYVCDDENRNNLNRRQLDKALSLIGIKQSKRNDIIKSMISSSSSSSLSPIPNKAKKRASFTSDDIKLETFLSKAVPEVDGISTNEFDSLLSFIKVGIDSKKIYNSNNNNNNNNNDDDDEYISIDELKHLLTTQSSSSLSMSEVNELLSGVTTSGDKVKWKNIVDALCWKISIS